MDNENKIAAESGKKAFRFDRAELVLLIMALAVAYVFVAFVFQGDLGIAGVIFIASVYIVTGIYCKLAGIHLKWNAGSIILAVLAAALTAPFGLLDMSPGRKFLTFAFVMCVIAMQLYTMLDSRRYSFSDRSYSLDWVDAVFVMPFANLGASWLTVGNAGKTGKLKGFLLGLLGFIIAIPLCAILLSLLMEADSAFSGLMERVNMTFGERAILEIYNVLKSIPFAMMAFGILYGLRYKNGLQKAKAMGVERSRRIPGSIAYGVLIPAVIIYCAYLVSQLAYFTSAFAGLLPAKFTYAEYARQGFFELCALCVINLSLTIAILSFVKAGKVFRRIFCSFFCIISLFLTATAMAKMVLYMDNYGLTPSRFHTTLFMSAIALTFLYILIRLYVERFPITQFIAVTAAAFFLTFAYVDAEALSVEYNLTAIETGRLADTSYLAGFEYEDFLYMSDAIEPVLRSHPEFKITAYVLNQRKLDRTNYPDSWTAWNLQSQLAKTAQ